MSATSAIAPVASANGAGRATSFAVAILAAAVALASARPYAGGWYDGSRLSTVETLVDQQKLEIDRSMFVRGPGSDPAAPNPFTPGDLGLQRDGTKDKLLIDGHYYSDKSPLPAVTLAGWYLALKRATNLEAREQPGRFCYWMTIGSSGLGYIAAVWCVYQMGVVIGLPLASRLLLTASLAFATIAPVYARHANNHAMLLGVIAALVLTLVRSASECAARRTPWARLLEAGALTGIGYAIDQGIGPVLVLTTTALMAWRTRRFTAVLLFILAAAPWIAGHHALNYRIGGTIAPASATFKNLNWPGSPFTPDNITGVWSHKTIGHFPLYAADILVGQWGFLSYNLPMFLAVAGGFVLRRRKTPERPELLYCAALSSGVWLVYAALSSNHAGVCCSIRWFLPLLAPGYFILAVLIREFPSTRCDLLTLSAFSAVTSSVCWWRGPWNNKLPLGFGFWVIYALGLVAWGVCAWRRGASGGETERIQSG